MNLSDAELETLAAKLLNDEHFRKRVLSICAQHIKAVTSNTGNLKAEVDRFLSSYRDVKIAEIENELEGWMLGFLRSRIDREKSKLAGLVDNYLEHHLNNRVTELLKNIVSDVITKSARRIKYAIREYIDDQLSNININVNIAEALKGYRDYDGD